LNTKLVRSIGVCNFTGALLHDLLTYAKVKPLVNQVELHPYLQQEKLVTYCQKEGIQVEAYSPLGTTGFIKPEEPNVLSDEVLNEIGKKYGKTSAQIALKWAIQRGTCPCPKSINPNRLKENFALFDFTLTEEEMKRIQKIEKNYRFLRPFDWYGIPLFE